MTVVQLSSFAVTARRLPHLLPPSTCPPSSPCPFLCPVPLLPCCSYRTGPFLVPNFLLNRRGQGFILGGFFPFSLGSFLECRLPTLRPTPPWLSPCSSNLTASSLATSSRSCSALCGGGPHICRAASAPSRGRGWKGPPEQSSVGRRPAGPGVHQVDLRPAGSPFGKLLQLSSSPQCAVQSLRTQCGKQGQSPPFPTAPLPAPGQDGAGHECAVPCWPHRGSHRGWGVNGTGGTLGSRTTVRLAVRVHGQHSEGNASGCQLLWNTQLVHSFPLLPTRLLKH